MDELQRVLRTKYIDQAVAAFDELMAWEDARGEDAFWILRR